MLLEETLLQAGASVLGPLGSSHEAMQVLAQFTPDVASLDWSVQDGTTAEVAIALQRAGVPFIFVTGNPREDILAHFPGEQVLTKPIWDFDGLVTRLAALCLRAADR